ncbi:MAG TPA: hypothetical protein VLB04_09880 [Methanotrichaceae archaeon]|nr:hypothetical protein [Methanotrichaceae archaeon]
MEHCRRAPNTGEGLIKIGVIGSGNVGSALGKIWGKNACYGTPAEVAKFCNVAMLAVPRGQVESAQKMGTNIAFGLPRR